MQNIIEMSRIRRDERTGLWLVEIRSAATGQWIVQGEHRTAAEARADRRNWT